MTLTISNKVYTVWGNKRAVIFDMDFGSSYPFDGEALTPETVGLSLAEQVIVSGRKGYDFEYDIANQKMKVFAPAPPIVYEEVVTVTAHVGYLKYPAAHIEYVTDDADDYRVIPGGLTPTAKFVAVDMGFSLTTGVLTRGQRTSLTFLAADTVTSCKVSYITQAWKEVADNMVQACMTDGTRVYGHADLAFGAATPDVVTIGEDMVAVQDVCWNDDGTLTPMSALKDAATLGAAATECIIDFADGLISFHQTDAVDVDSTVYFNYIKDPGAGHFLHDRFDITEIADA